MKRTLPRTAGLSVGAVLFSALGILRAAEPPATIHTLKEAYTAAVQNSDQVAASSEAVHQAEALYRQTLGSALPILSFHHTSTWQDGSVGSGGDSSINGSSRNEGALHLTETSFSGYREIMAVRSGHSLIAERVEEERRVEQLLLSDLAVAFFGHLQAQENATTSQQLADLAGKRLDELKNRVRLGRSRETEAIEQDFQISALDSQYEEYNRLVAEQADLLRYLTGVDSVQPSIDDTVALQTPRELSSYLQRIDNRPDVRALQRSVDVGLDLVRVARSGHIPTLGLTANRYLYRPTNRDGIDWDVNLTVDAPLWSWGAVKGSVDAAQAVMRQRERLLSDARRQAGLAIRNAFRDLQSAQRQLDIQQHAVDLAQSDFEIQRKDDRRGLVTNIDVLQSLDRLNSARLAVTNSRLSARLAALNLELAAGAGPEEILP